MLELPLDPVANLRPRAEEIKSLSGKVALVTGSTSGIGLGIAGEKQPSLEFATPGEIGATALFLCSQAAAQIRGIGLPIDGGWTAQ